MEGIETKSKVYSKALTRVLKDYITATIIPPEAEKMLPTAAVFIDVQPGLFVDENYPLVVELEGTTYDWSILEFVEKL